MPGLRTRIYECHVTGVHELDRVIDARSRSGRVFKQIGYLLPWISANGSGIDIVPKTGDQCLVLATPEAPRGRQGPPAAREKSASFAVCIGFKVPVSVNSQGLELGERLSSLPQGSMGLRTLSEDGNEALLLLTRGGTALIAANSGCRTLYSPVDSSIIHLFNNWEMNGPGGHVKWMRREGSDVVKYEAQYRVGTAEDTGVRVDVRVGGEGEDDPVDIVVGTPDHQYPYLRVRVDANGEAHVEGESINITGRANVNIDAPQVMIKNRQVLDQGDPI